MLSDSNEEATLSIASDAAERWKLHQHWHAVQKALLTCWIESMTKMIMMTPSWKCHTLRLSCLRERDTPSNQIYESKEKKRTNVSIVQFQTKASNSYVDMQNMSNSHSWKSSIDASKTDPPASSESFRFECHLRLSPVTAGCWWR